MTNILLRGGEKTKPNKANCAVLRKSTGYFTAESQGMRTNWSNDINTISQCKVAVNAV
jgi:hypothetical protein